ncbi:MAG TPA: VOC family protein [Alphaproteobacteria bacterium]|nr:VOC family protein [Alphaproteobacteria bacterium]
MSGRSLDHLVLAVKDLAAAAEHWAALGFQTTPPAQHPFGTGNRLVQFGNGSFLELLAVTEAEKVPGHTVSRYSFARHNADFLDRREGLSFLVLGTDDARRDHGAFWRAGLQVFEPVDFERDALLPDGTTGRVAFSLVFPREAERPSLPLFLCQQRAPEVFWQEAYQRHPNGALGIVETVAVSADPEEQAPFLAQVAGDDAVAMADGELVVRLANGRLRLIPPARLPLEYLGVRALPERLYLAGFTVAVADLGALTRHLDAGKVSYAQVGGTVTILPARSHGVALRFVGG